MKEISFRAISGVKIGSGPQNGKLYMRTMRILAVTVTSLTIMSSGFAESEGSSNKKKVLNVKKCISLVKKTCGEKDYKSCMNEKSEKTAHVSECLSYLVTENKKKKINTEGLGKSVKKLIANSEMTKDQRKCFEVSKLVCREGENLNECMRKRAGKFPSFCREAAIQGIDSLKEIYKNDRKAAMCADLLVAKCDFVLPEAKEKPDPKLYQAALNKYQACVKSQVNREKECKDVVDPKREGGSTQLVQ